VVRSNPVQIRALNVSNFRSLGDDVRVEFPREGGRLIALAGINGAGKSNVLDAFGFVGDVTRAGIAAAMTARGGEGSVLREGSSRLELAVELEDGEGRLVWGLGLSPHDTLWGRGWEWGYAVPARSLARYDAELQAALDDGTGRSGAPGRAGVLHDLLDRGGLATIGWQEGTLSGPQSGGLAEQARGSARWRAVQEHLAAWRTYVLPVETIREPRSSGVERVMERDGGNWPSVLRSLDPAGAGLELRAALCRLVPDLTDYDVLDAGGRNIARFRHRGATGDVWRAAPLESDGTLRAAALVTATLQRPLPVLLGVEEPETAIHVRALGLIVDFLLDAAEHAQVVLTTQSPDLLDLLPPDAVRVVTRGDGGTAVHPIDPVQRAVLRDGGGTGALLREQGLFPDEAAGG